MAQLYLFLGQIRRECQKGVYNVRHEVERRNASERNENKK
jgi:hypothetical protein